MARPLLRQEIAFSGNASTSGCVAYFPNALRGQYLDWTVYVEYSASTSAGKVQVETAITANENVADYAGVWAVIGSTIDWAVESSQKVAAVTGCYDLLRLKINTTVASGTVKGYVLASAKE